MNSGSKFARHPEAAFLVGLTCALVLAVSPCGWTDGAARGNEEDFWRETVDAYLDGQAHAELAMRAAINDGAATDRKWLRSALSRKANSLAREGGQVAQLQLVLERLVDCTRGVSIEDRDIVFRMLVRDHEPDEFLPVSANKVDAVLRSTIINSRSLEIGSAFNLRWLLPFAMGATNHPAGVDHDAEWDRYAMRARARMGDSVAIAAILKVCEDMASSNPHDLVPVFEPMGFIRQPDAIVFLRRFLESEELLQGFRDSGEGLPVAQLAAYYLERSLVGFPVRHREGPWAYTPADIAACRAWMKAHEGRWNIRGGYAWEGDSAVPVMHSVPGGVESPSEEHDAR